MTANTSIDSPAASSTTEVSSSASANSQSIMFVDLDGTLIKTDLLVEALVLAVARRPQLLLEIPGWLAAGRAVLKRNLATFVAPSASTLPYREEVVQFLHAQRNAGRRLVLATASDLSWAQPVADELGLFEGVIASDGNINMKGVDKLHSIQAYCQKNKVSSFAYLGDSRADLPIWQQAEEIHVVEPSPGLAREIRQIREPCTVFGARQFPWRALWRVLRPHQWAKNLLLFVPLIMAHSLFDLHKLWQASLAFIAFSCCASGVYVLNDLLDIESDRKHPIKRKRPFASGSLPMIWGPLICGGLFAIGWSISYFVLGWGFTVALGVYLLMTTLYSFWLKRLVILDVIVLANLYTLRVICGGIATEVVVSEWLMAFSLFLFTSLAFVKRYAELNRLADEERTRTAGRGYQVTDLAFLQNAGIASGFLSVLVLAQYINSDAMKIHYSNPWALWLMCPLMLYWICRLWLLANRKEMSEDPVVFAVRDVTSIAIALLAGGLLWLASVPL